jgi:hypothetical protein
MGGGIRNADLYAKKIWEAVRELDFEKPSFVRKVSNLKKSSLKKLGVRGA